MLLLTLFVGHVADRYDHRIILMLCQIDGRLRPPRSWCSARRRAALDTATIYVVVALVGAARAFEIPTMAAIIAAPGAARGGAVGDGLVRLRQPDRADRRARRSAACSMCSVRSTVYGITIVLWGLGGVLLAHDAGRARRRAAPSRSASRSLLGGFRFVRGDRVILGTLSLDMFAVLLGGATALLPIFARDILQTGPWGLGLLALGARRSAR